MSLDILVAMMLASSTAVSTSRVYSGIHIRSHINSQTPLVKYFPSEEIDKPKYASDPIHY